MNNYHNKQQYKHSEGAGLVYEDTMKSSYLASIFLSLVHVILSLLYSIIAQVRKIIIFLYKYRNTRDQDNVLKVSVPRHVVLQVEKAWPKSLLASLPWWTLAAGVTHLTFYDPDGVIDDEDKLVRAVENYKTDIPGHILWRSRREKNGLSKSITVDVIRQRDCKPKIVNLVKDMCEEVKAGALDTSDVDVSYVDTRLNKLRNIPDPDLSIYCGERCCTKGLLPWNIRLTEFMAFQDPDNVCMEEFQRILWDYSRHEQRFGK